MHLSWRGALCGSQFDGDGAYYNRFDHSMACIDSGSDVCADMLARAPRNKSGKSEYTFLPGLGTRYHSVVEDRRDQGQDG